MQTKRKANDRLEGLITLGENNNNALDKLCAFLLAISPILQHYQGIFTEAGVLIIIVLFPYIFLKLLLKLCNGKIALVLPVVLLFLYHLYRVINHGTSISQILHAAVLVVYFLAASSGCINIKQFVKAAAYVAVAASIFLVIQYFGFYLLNYHWHPIPTDLLLEESARWVSRAETGAGGTFYRPSAFFLEPSHFFLYSFPTLLIMLFAPNMNSWRFKIAALITLGLVLSTSGMGIGFAIGSWVLYLCLYKGKDNVAKMKKLLSPKSMIIIVLIPAVLTILYFYVDFFRLSLERVFIPTTGSSAIQGRIRGATALVSSLKGADFWFGVGSLADVESHMAGFFATFYRHGLVGVILSYAFYVYSLFKLKAQYFWISFIIILISFFTAHTHGTFYMLYYVIILMAGHNLVKHKNRVRSVSKN